jgi:DNA-directed RNA polymerase specialized sigma24 family protein
MRDDRSADGMNESEEFLRLLTDSQGRLFAYFAAALGDFDRANEVLQETNLVMWRKSGEFEMGSNFNAWSYRIAYFWDGCIDHLAIFNGALTPDQIQKLYEVGDASMRDFRHTP